MKIRLHWFHHHLTMYTRPDIRRAIEQWVRMCENWFTSSWAEQVNYGRNTCHKVKRTERSFFWARKFRKRIVETTFWKYVSCDSKMVRNIGKSRYGNEDGVRYLNFILYSGLHGRVKEAHDSVRYIATDNQVLIKLPQCIHGIYKVVCPWGFRVWGWE